MTRYRSLVLAPRTALSLTLLLPVLLALVLICPAGARAEEFPSHPIRMVVPYPPGASTDIVGRMVAQKISTGLGQQVVVDNRAGASGNIGSEAVAHAAPDGYTIMLGTDATHGTNAHLAKNFPFDPVKDFTPLTAAAENIIVLVVNPAVPVTNIKELIEYAKANPGKLSYGSSGTGSPHHLSGELLAQLAHINLVHVAYRGGGPAVTDVLANQIPMVFSSLVSVVPYIKSGKLRAIAVTDTKRYAGLPDVPTIGETVPGFEMTSWLGFFGPANMPPAIVRRYNTELVKALNDPDVHSKMEAAGLVVIANSPDEFAATVRHDFAERGKLISSAGIQGD